MTDFKIDGGKRFTENCADFLESVKDIDPEMAEILKANWEVLQSVVREGERDTKARLTFNEAVAASLDNLLADRSNAGGE